MAPCPTLVSLRTLLGDEAMVRLLALLGGETVHIPKRRDFGPCQELAAKLRLALGDQAAEALRREYAGQTIRLPFSDVTVNYARRDFDIEQLLRNGHPIGHICRHYSYLERPTPALVRSIARRAGLPASAGPCACSSRSKIAKKAAAALAGSHVRRQ